jgi:hypothetical protein
MRGTGIPFNGVWPKQHELPLIFDVRHYSIGHDRQCLSGIGIARALHAEGDKV